MLKQNKLIAYFSKRETALIWLVFSVGLFAVFAFMQNPVTYTISEIGRAHHSLFVLFCTVYSVAMLTNLVYMRKNFHIKDKLFYYLSVAFSSTFGFVATTVLFDKSIGEETLVETIAHWFFGFGGILVNTVCVLVFLLSFWKATKSKKLKAVFWANTIACILDLLSFVLLTVLAGGNVQKSKNGFLEIIPMTATFFVIYVINHTDLVSKRSERDSKENDFVILDDSLFSAISFGTLAFSWVAFTLYAFVRNPIHYTISMTGIQYPIGFAIVSVSLAVSFILNFIQMYKKNGYKNGFTWFLSMTGPLAIVVCVFSPTKMGTELDLVHSVAALVYFFFILGAFILYYLHFRKDEKRKPLLISVLVITALVALTAVLLFIVFKQKYGRTGLTEVVPLEFFFFCFLLENHSSYFSEKRENKKIINV